jgi:hypothetical protein
LSTARPNKALPLLTPMFNSPPFSPVVRDSISIAVEKIIDEESKRGAMSRSDRSVLSPKAQPFQDFIDAVFFALAGLTKDEVAGLRVRYEAMKKVK